MTKIKLLGPTYAKAFKRELLTVSKSINYLYKYNYVMVQMFILHKGK